MVQLNGLVQGNIYRKTSYFHGTIYMVSGLRREPLNQSIENMYKMIDPKVEFHHVSSINHGWRLKF
jgi:hypothetical protein